MVQRGLTEQAWKHRKPFSAVDRDEKCKRVSETYNSVFILAIRKILSLFPNLGICKKCFSKNLLELSVLSGVRYLVLSVLYQFQILSETQALHKSKYTRHRCHYCRINVHQIPSQKCLGLDAWIIVYNLWDVFA